jgi:hypothetical protein
VRERAARRHKRGRELSSRITLTSRGIAGHYSQAMVVPPNASLVVVSAQYPTQAPMAGGANVTGSVTDQVRPYSASTAVSSLAPG